jgi:hypothetical protein
MHLSPHDCDLLLADAVPPDRAKALREHAGACQACGALLGEAEATRAAFLVANPPAARAHALLDELGRAPRPGRGWWWALGSAAALAALLLLVRVPDETRLKGEALACRLMRGGQVVALLRAGERQPAAPGDSLRCTVAPAQARHLEVWGADRASGAHRLFDGELSGPSEIPPGSAFAVEGSGAMRLYFVWSTKAAPGDLAQKLAVLPDQPSADGSRIEWIGVEVP